MYRPASSTVGSHLMLVLIASVLRVAVPASTPCNTRISALDAIPDLSDTHDTSIRTIRGGPQVIETSHLFR